MGNKINPQLLCTCTSIWICAFVCANVFGISLLSYTAKCSCSGSSIYFPAVHLPSYCTGACTPVAAVAVWSHRGNAMSVGPSTYPPHTHTHTPHHTMTPPLPTSNSSQKPALPYTSWFCFCSSATRFGMVPGRKEVAWYGSLRLTTVPVVSTSGVFL